MNRVGDRLQWIGGAGDDMVAAYYSIGFALSGRASPPSRRDSP